MPAARGLSVHLGGRQESEQTNVPVERQRMRERVPRRNRHRAGALVNVMMLLRLRLATPIDPIEYQKGTVGPHALDTGEQTKTTLEQPLGRT